MLLAGAFVPSLAQEDVNLAPFYFHSGESASDGLASWNRLMKYKIWGTEGVTFNKEDVIIRETSGYTGTASGNVTFNNGRHVLGGPILSGKDLVFSYPGTSPDKDSLYKGPVRAHELVLANWYDAPNTFYEGNYCFDGTNIYMDQGDDNARKKWVDNVKNGKVYANFDAKFRHEPFANCPKGPTKDGIDSIPEPDYNLFVPEIAAPASWEPGLNITLTVPETKYIHIPPIESDKDSTWYNKFMESIVIGGTKDKKLYILMPRKTHNANHKNGRLTRIFLRDGLTIMPASNNTHIEVVYVNSEATWDKAGQQWKNFVIHDTTVVKNSEYAGNLLFYTTKDITWENMIDPNYQGTFMTTGSFSIKNHINLAGQLLSRNISFEADVKGDFHYVPFNPPEIDIGVFSSDKFIEKDALESMGVGLTSAPETEVSFKYCFEFFGNLSESVQKQYSSWNFATVDDLNFEIEAGNTAAFMPLCSKNEFKEVVVHKGETEPNLNFMPNIIVKVDDLVEGDEWMIFKVWDLNGAVLAGDRFDGGIPLKLTDSSNDPPVIDTKSVLAVLEETANAKAGKVKATDPEGTAELVFNIIGGSAMDLFDISVSGDVSLKTGVDPLDYESWCGYEAACSTHNPKYEIEVQVCEKKASMVCDTAKMEVLVKDVNENPIVKDDTLEILENAAGGSTVGRIPLDDIDVDLNFRVNTMKGVGGDTAIFDVLANGRIALKADASLDYESDSLYELKVRLEDSGNPDLFDTATITIKVKDFDDGPYFGDISDGSVKENSPVNTLVNSVVAICSDKSKVLTYTLDDPTGTFKIDAKTGAVTVAEATLDYERQQSYIVTVHVSDNGAKPQTASVQVNILVEDVNENPVFEGDSATFAENLPKGQVVTTLTAGDIDVAEDFRKNMFMLAGGDTAGFALDPLTGVITTTREFDYETDKTVLTLQVTVRDIEDSKLAVTENVVISLTNVNEAPYVVTPEFSVNENVPGGSIIGVIQGADPDAGDSVLTFSVPSGSGDLPFSVFADGSIVVKEDAVIDFETKDTYEFTVRVMDMGGLSSDTVITIHVKDVNEPPMVDDQRFVVEENVDVPSSVGFVDASDPDKDATFSSLTCKIAEESEFFAVGADCSITVKSPLDYETDSLYKIGVVVTDGWLSDTAEVTVVVKDVFEKTDVVITRAENKDSVWLNPDTIYVNHPGLNIEWKVDDELMTDDTTLTEGPNVIIKEVCDEHKNVCGRDTLVVYVSTAAPIVTVSAEKKDVKADNIYTVVEEVAEKDTAFYVNTSKNDIKVTVSDTVAGYSKSFTVNVDLDVAQVPNSVFKTVGSIADAKISLDEKADVLRTPENGERIKVTYSDRVNGKDVLVTYYTDNDGKILKTPVVVDGKEKEIEAIVVSYTEMVDGREVVVSYTADASSGKRVEISSGVGEGESSKAIVGDFTVSYDYVDKSGNKVVVSYTVDENGNIVSNSEGNKGYQVSYTYTNQYGNSATQSLFIVLDQVGPVVEIISPTKNAVIYENFVHVDWRVNGVDQDTLNVQGLDKGPGYIVRTYRDKAGNEATATVPVIMKNVKDIEIQVEKPVTIVNADSVQKYYEKNQPEEDDRYAVSILKPSTGSEVETIIGGKDGEREGSGKEPYPGLDGHLGPSLGIDLRLPRVNDLGGLATLDDLVGKDGMVALDGVDAANSEKVTVDEFIREHCSTEFVEHRYSDNSKMNLYDIDVDIRIWVYSSLGNFVDYFSFTQKMNDPELVNGAGFAKMNFELKPDLDGNIRTSENGRLLGTGAYIFKTEVTMKSKLRCDLPPVSDTQKINNKKGAVMKASEELLKKFGYRKPEKSK